MPGRAIRKRTRSGADSPWYQLVTSGELQMRRRLAAGEGSNEFPLLAGLAAQGGTDYWARVVPFGDQRPIGETRGVATSWATCDPRAVRRRGSGPD